MARIGGQGEEQVHEEAITVEQDERGDSGAERTHPESENRAQVLGDGRKRAPRRPGRFLGAHGRIVRPARVVPKRQLE